MSYEDLIKARAERAAKETAKEAKKVAKEAKKATPSLKVKKASLGKGKVIGRGRALCQGHIRQRQKWRGQTKGKQRKAGNKKKVLGLGFSVTYLYEGQLSRVKLCDHHREPQ
jgi:hypothetical protein